MNDSNVINNRLIIKQIFNLINNSNKCKKKKTKTIIMIMFQNFRVDSMNNNEPLIDNQHQI